MAYHNQVTLVGNATRDPELKYLPNGTAVAKIGIGMTRRYSTSDGQKKEEVTFVDVDFLGKTAEVVGKYVNKGSPILVHGRLKLDQWDDKKTGEKRSKLCVLGEGVQLLSKAPEGAAPAAAPARQVQPPITPRQAAAGVTNDGPSSDSDDVPF